MSGNSSNWWETAKKSHSKLQSSARRSAPVDLANDASRFVDCPACGASMHRQSLNHHLDLDCPVLHGYGDGARASDAGSSARSSIQSGPRRSDAAPEGAAASSDGAAAATLPSTDGATAPARPSDASRYAACPVCSESVLVSDMNYHLELKCMGSTAEAPAPEPGAGPIAADAIGACPMCDMKMSLREIADHIDAGCPRLAAAAPSPPRESRVLDDLRQGASCPLCMDVLDDPHCLPCAHAFCKECILRAFQTTRPGHGHECPVCRAPCRKRSIQPAAQLRALVDIVRAADAAAAPAEAEAELVEAPPSPAPPSPAPPSPAPAAASPPAAPSTRPRANSTEAHALPSADEMAAAPQSPEEVATLERVRGNLARALAAEPPVAASPAAPPSPTPPSSPLLDRAAPPPAKSLLARRRAAESAPDEKSPPPAATPTDPVAEPSPAPSPAPSRSPSPEPLVRRRPRRAAARSSDDAALAARLQDAAGPPTPEEATWKKRRRRRK